MTAIGDVSGAAARSGSARTCAACGATRLSTQALSHLCPACLLRCAVDDPSVRVGGYEILEELGRGGMGVVYLASHDLLNKPVALKMMQPDFPASEAMLELFRREIALAEAAASPGIAQVLHVGEDDGRLYFTMPLYEASLAHRLADFRSPRAAAGLVQQLARAVQHAHDRGVLHLDLKPANVLLDASGAPYVADFGLGKLLSERRSSEASGVDESAGGRPSTGTAETRWASRPDGGTLQYMAPEQIARAKFVTTAVDVYGLGLILYEVLTGRPAFDAGLPSLERGRARRIQSSPRVFAPGLHRDLEAICLRCLEPDPARRYRSAGDLADDLGRFLRHEPVSVRRPSLGGRAWRFGLRRPLAVLFAAGASVLLATVVSDLLRIAAAQRAELRGSVLRANEWAAEVASDAVLYLLRERMEWVEQMAREPLMAELAAGPPLASAPQLEPYQRGRFDIVVVLDRQGMLNAIWPKGKRDVVRRDYAWRDYFRSACEADARDVETGAYVARSFESENDDDYNLSISAPIVRDGRCQGVVLTTILTDSAIGPFRLIPRGDPRHKGVLLGPQDRRREALASGFPEPYLVLLHDRLRSAEGVPLPLELSRRLRSAFGTPLPRGAQLEVSRVPPLMHDRYVDPLGDPEERWLVAFRPVGGTGFVVGVQTRDDLVEAPIVTLLRGLARIAAIVVAAGLVLAAASAWLRRRVRAG